MREEFSPTAHRDAHDVAELYKAWFESIEGRKPPKERLSRAGKKALRIFREHMNGSRTSIWVRIKYAFMRLWRSLLRRRAANYYRDAILRMETSGLTAAVTNVKGNVVSFRILNEELKP